MNLIELLLLLAFVFFPLIQALLEKLGKGREDSELPPPPDLDQDAPQMPVESRSAPIEVAGGHGPEDWSSGWESWPGEDSEVAEEHEAMEDLSAEEVVTEDEADELIAYQERLAARELPEAARVTVPVVSMEPLRVDRKSEHRRMHEVHASVPAVRRPVRSPASGLGAALRSGDELRRAVLLAEILGPPRAMRAE